MDIAAACRKCDGCLEHRRKLWTARAIDEVRMANRTWFGTLTLQPSEQHRALAIARKLEAQQGGDFDKLDAQTQFRLRVEAIGPWITLWLKRVRKQSGARVRYLLVVEAHESGLPHFHLLMHECGAVPVTKRCLQEQWPHGFSSFVLAKSEIGHKAAWYICKYVAKSALCRIRASAAYGRARLGGASSPEGQIRQGSEEKEPVGKEV